MHDCNLREGFMTSRVWEVGSRTGGNLVTLSASRNVCVIEMDKTARGAVTEKTSGPSGLQRGCFPEDIPFEGGTFDFIGMFDVLQLVERDIEECIANSSLRRCVLVPIRSALARGNVVCLERVQIWRDKR